jgi:hypothetical protein
MTDGSDVYFDGMAPNSIIFDVYLMLALHNGIWSVSLFPTSHVEPAKLEYDKPEYSLSIAFRSIIIMMEPAQECLVPC